MIDTLLQHLFEYREVRTNGYCIENGMDRTVELLVIFKVIINLYIKAVGQCLWQVFTRLQSERLNASWPTFVFQKRFKFGFRLFVSSDVLKFYMSFFFVSHMTVFVVRLR